jgi:hypothetical protein
LLSAFGRYPLQSTVVIYLCLIVPVSLITSSLRTNSTICFRKTAIKIQLYKKGNQPSRPANSKTLSYQNFSGNMPGKNLGKNLLPGKEPDFSRSLAPETPHLPALQVRNSSIASSCNLFRRRFPFLRLFVRHIYV